jgi:hypothetical protein
MTDTIDGVAAEAAGQEPVEPVLDEQSVAEQLVAQAREKGIELVGPDGLLSQLTKRVLPADDQVALRKTEAVAWEGRVWLRSPCVKSLTGGAAVRLLVS